MNMLKKNLQYPLLLSYSKKYDHSQLTTWPNSEENGDVEKEMMISIRVEVYTKTTIAATTVLVQLTTFESLVIKYQVMSHAFSNKNTRCDQNTCSSSSNNNMYNNLREHSIRDVFLAFLWAIMNQFTNFSHLNMFSNQANSYFSRMFLQLFR